MSSFEMAHIAEKSSAGRLTEFGDEWLMEILDLTKEEMTVLQRSLKVLKNHRLRHGKTS